MLLLRAVARLVAMLWLLAIALLGLGVAAYCFDGVIRLHELRPDRLLHLSSVRRHVGHFLTQLGDPGPAAGLALLCGIGAMMIGVLLISGILVPRRRHVALLSDGDGDVAARPRTVRAMARALAAEVDGVTAVRRPRLRLSRRGTRGRLRLTVVRTSIADPGTVERAVSDRLLPITDPFSLQPRVRVERASHGERVQ